MLDNLRNAVIGGKPRLAVQETEQAIRDGYPKEQILNEGLLPAMHEISREFKKDEPDLAHTLSCAKAMKNSLNLLQANLEEETFPSKGLVIIGTCGGDLHDIGKNVVAVMFEGIGAHILDLGVDVSSERFVKNVREHPEVRVVCISCLLTTSFREMERTVQNLRKERKRSGLDFIIMVGGAPVTQKIADKMGADIYTENAAKAAEAALPYL